MRMRGTSSAVPSAAATKEFATSIGARDSVVLADGSRVILGPASHIVVRGREVELTTGEAFFVVVHNEKRPFTVRVGGAVIRDIGTEFSVRTDRESELQAEVRVPHDHQRRPIRLVLRF